MKQLRTAVAGLVLMMFAGAALAQSLVNGQVPSVIPPGVYTASTVTGPTITNIGNTVADIIFTVTAYASGTYTPHIQGIDSSGNPYDILVGTAISGNTASPTAYILTVGAGVLPVPNRAAASPLPIKWRVIMVGASTPSMTVVANANVGL